MEADVVTLIPEFRFRCDRCRAEDVLPMGNGAARYDPPSGWATMRLTADVSTPAGHLCPECNIALNKFMEAPDVRPEGSGT
jgi:predicted nucleic acid-binding Zn ribbon protein